MKHREQTRARPRVLWPDEAPPEPPTMRLVGASQPPAWRINGYRFEMAVWSADQFAGLADPPADAQRHPLGFWVALRPG